MKTVVLHCKSLPERRRHMEEQLAREGIRNVLFITQADPSDPPPVFQVRVAPEHDPHGCVDRLLLWGAKGPSCHTAYHLNAAQVSLTTKFGLAFQVLAASGAETALVLEDDAILCPGFLDAVQTLLADTPDDWDVIYAGACLGMRPAGRLPGQRVYRMPHPASRGACAVLLRSKAIQDLAANWFPFRLVSDWELAYRHWRHNHRVYWWDPPPVTQGSETGLFPSSLS